jgi:hypothetical protein
VAFALQMVLLAAMGLVSAVGASWAGRLIADRTVAERARFALYLRRQGLGPLESGLGSAFVGTWRSRPVRLLCSWAPGPQGARRVTISVGTTVPTGQLRMGHVRAWFGRSALPTGDPGFDRCFRVSGDARALATLTSEVREAVLQAACWGTPRIADGALWLDFTCEPAVISQVHLLLDPLIELAERLTRASEVPLVKLWIDWMTDPEPGVRRSCLDLVDAHHDGQSLPPFVAVMLADPDPGVRMRAATLLGKMDVVASVAMQSTASPRVRIEAVRALIRRGTERQRLEVAWALAESGEPLAKAAVALCNSAGAAAEPLVMDWLDVHRAHLVRGAVRWAGRYGSLAVLSRLRAIEERAARLSPLSLETHQAIAQVRARSSQAIGSVSLCPPQGWNQAEGALSLPRPGGELSLAETEATGG